jgi:hypothetical protein
VRNFVRLTDRDSKDAFTCCNATFRSVQGAFIGIGANSMSRHLKFNQKIGLIATLVFVSEMQTFK